MSLHDVTNVTFIAGVTNFTLDNVFTACRNNGMTDRDWLKMTVPLHIYDRLDANNLIDFDREGRKSYHRIAVEIAPNFDPSKQEFAETVIQDSNGRTVVLRTREF